MVTIQPVECCRLHGIEQTKKKQMEAREFQVFFFKMKFCSIATAAAYASFSRVAYRYLTKPQNKSQPQPPSVTTIHSPTQPKDTSVAANFKHKLQQTVRFENAKQVVGVISLWITGMKNTDFTNVADYCVVLWLLLPNSRKKRNL